MNTEIPNVQKHVFLKWKNKLGSVDVSQDSFERWLFIQASGVIFGGKSGELLILKKDCFRLPFDNCLEHISSFCKSWKLRYSMLVMNGSTLKLIIYREEAVNLRLKKASKKILHCHLKYPFGLSAQSFLHELSVRWQSSGRIPHEIGIALGYPLKDVWGFMGLNNFRCNGSCGWQIFGDPEPSKKTRARYENARRRAEQLLRAA